MRRKTKNNRWGSPKRRIYTEPTPPKKAILQFGTLDQLMIDAKTKLRREKNIYIDTYGKIGWYLLARAISQEYGYEFRETIKHKCIEFVFNYMNNQKLRLTSEMNHLTPEQTTWYKSKEFLLSDEWFKFRYRIIELHGNKCQCCGATPATGAIIQVDHIKPRSIYPELALVESNAQILCRVCNLGKSNLYKTDWR